MKIQDYMSVSEAAEIWDVTLRQVQIMCSSGKIPDAIRFGRAWAIPVDTKKPTRTGKLKPGPKPKELRNKNTEGTTK
jgi:hypothetical protein